MRMFSRTGRFFAAAGAAAGLGLAGTAAADSLPVQVVAGTGDSALGLPAGAEISQLGVPVISQNGDYVAFTGTITGGGVGTGQDERVFRTFTGSNWFVSSVAAESDFVPGTGNGWYWSGEFDDVRISNEGRMVFTAKATSVPGGTVGRGAFTYHSQHSMLSAPGIQISPLPTTAHVTSQRGTPALGAGGVASCGLNAQINSQFFQGQGSTIRTKIAGVSGVGTLAAMTGDPAPNLPFGTMIGALPVWNPRVTGDGALYFAASLSGGGASGGATQGVFRGGFEAQTELVFRGGEIGTLAWMGTPDLLSAASGGHVLFLAKYQTLLTTAANDDAIWRHTPAGRQMLAREGTGAPGLPGIEFDWFSTESYINGRGEAVFTSGLKGLVHPGNDSAIWRDAGSGPELVVREVHNAPGIPLVTIGQLYSATINNTGQIAFWTALRGTPVTPENDGSLWVWTPGVGLTLVAREGDPIPLSTGGSKTLAGFSVHMGGPDDGQGTFLSDTGRVVYRASFTDGSRAIVYATVPLPPQCYANCDGSTVSPVLNVDDFVCFQQKFAAGDAYANCDGSTTPPVLNVDDFVCFQQRFAAGCE